MIQIKTNICKFILNLYIFQNFIRSLNFLAFASWFNSENTKVIMSILAFSFAKTLSEEGP